MNSAFALSASIRSHNRKGFVSHRRGGQQTLPSRRGGHSDAASVAAGSHSLLPRVTVEISRLHLKPLNERNRLITPGTTEKFENRPLGPIKIESCFQELASIPIRHF